MILIVDSWAWLKLLEDETDPMYAETLAYLENKNNRLYTNILNLYEVFNKSMDKTNRERAVEFIQFIKSQAGIVLVDEPLAMLAATVHRSEGLPAIDAFVYATALRLNGKVLTGDPHFKGKKNAIFLG